MPILSLANSRNLGLRKDIFPFLLGFLSISIQIFLLREFQVIFYGNEVVYGFVLGFWLLWGSMGSLLAAKLSLQKKHIELLLDISLLLAIIIFVFLRLARFLWGKPFGESLGLTASFFSALIACFFLSFPFGLLFYLNVLYLEGKITRVYLYESLGACLAGIAIDLGLIRYFSCWQALTLIGLFTLLLIHLFSSWKKSLLWLFLLLIFICLPFFDFPLQKIATHPFPLIKTHDSRFGRWQVIKIDDQFTLYQNGLAAASIPDPAEAEEIVHFALLQRPRAENVLLIGGGFGGAIEEILKYPLATVDYVEIDPDIIKLVKDHLQSEKKFSFESTRVNFYFLDGRTFLQKTAKVYEVIILAVPEPATAQLNRFYTHEFFSLIKQHLSPQGVFSLKISSAENYQSPSLVRYLKTIFSTLASVFSQIEIIPGETNIFLASDGPLSIDYNFLTNALKDYRIETKYIRPQTLFARLSPGRVKNLKDKVSSALAELNSDLKPKAYFYFLIYWASQFGLKETKIMESVLNIPSYFLVFLPLLLISALACPWLITKRISALSALPLLVLGFTSMMAEVLILLWFQLLFGFIYEKIALLIACFMFGLFAGAALSLKGGPQRPFYFWLILDQASFLVILLLLLLLLPIKIPSLIPYFFLSLLGVAGGHLFVISNQPLVRRTRSYGLGYALDLVGSFLGAILGPPLFFPLLGLPVSILSLIILNVGCLLVLIISLPFQKRMSLNLFNFS